MSSSGIKECYGRFSETAECSVCELRVHCLDAGDIKPINAVEYQDYHSIDHQAEQEECASPPALAGAMLEIADAAARHPDAWQVVVTKIRAGSSKSLADIARELGISSKQAVHYHILKFTRECPAVFDALLFDRRYQHHKASKHYRLTPKWIDNKERKRRARLQRRTKNPFPFLPGMEPNE